MSKNPKSSSLLFDSRVDKEQKKYLKYIKWILFTGLIAILPIGLDIAFRKVTGVPVKIESLIGKGELLLLSCALAAGGLGEIFFTTTTDNKNLFPRVITGFLGLVFLLFLVPVMVLSLPLLLLPLI